MSTPAPEVALEVVVRLFGSLMGVSLDGRIVLVVEDEPLIRMHIADVLCEAGLHVLEAGNAAEALGVLECRGDITDVVTDVRMPGTLDGLDLAHLIAEQWKHVCLVVISGHASAADPRLPAAASFIQKPFPVNALLSRLLH